MSSHPTSHHRLNLHRRPANFLFFLCATSPLKLPTGQTTALQGLNTHRRAILILLHHYLILILIFSIFSISIPLRLIIIIIIILIIVVVVVVAVVVKVVSDQIRTGIGSRRRSPSRF